METDNPFGRRPTAEDSGTRRTLSAGDYGAVLRRVIAEVRNDHLTLLSGGIAFYSFVAIFPGLLAAMTVYGLVADPQQVQEQIATFASALPGDPGDPTTVQGIIATGMERATTQDRGALTASLVITLAGALWTASAGVAGLVEGVNAAYDLVDERSFLKRRGLALLLTFGGILFVTVAVALIAVTPLALRLVGLGGVGSTLISVGRWPLLAVAVMAALAVVYRVGPYRDSAPTRWRSPGAAAATLLFLVVSAGFSLYVTSFGGSDSYQATYGALAGVVVLLFWLFLSALAVLVGAEINNELEKEYRRHSEVPGWLGIARKDAYLVDTTAS